MPKDLFQEHGIDLLKEPKNPEEGGFFSNLGKGALNLGGGILRGVGQSAGDFGASVINWPIEGIESLTGKTIPHVPHPHLINENPSSLSESIGQNLGRVAGALALPGGAALKGAQLANKGYQVFRAGKSLPFLAELLATSGGGAIEGAAANEGHRDAGALLGGALGAALSSIPFIQSINSSNIANSVKNEFGRIKKDFHNRFENSLSEGEKAGANNFLKAEKANLSLFRKADEGKLAYGIEKFNANPTLRNAHRAQSDLNKIVNKYSHSKGSGALSSDVYDEALKLKNRLLNKITDALEKSSGKESAANYIKNRDDYAKYAAPYLESHAISELLGKNKRGVPAIRTKQFADKLIKEDDFMAAEAHKYPGLLRRERINKIKNNSLTPTLAAGVLGGAAGAFLPYEISKLLGH